MQHAVHEDGAVSEGYVTHVDSGYYVAGTRVSLDSIVYAFLAGQTAEAIAQSLPSRPEPWSASRRARPIERNRP